MDYHYFGDVVCFDPTYLTNRYGMPFAPIIGVNHHYQTTIFGGALLFDESEESFAWVMMTWMKAMEGKEPKVILTDQESAIGGAISRILPNARHRFCSWHIMRNALKNLAHIFNTHKGIKSDFEQFLYGFETIEEFETQWEKMIDTYTLKDNEWLMKLYQKRNKWAAVYSRDLFCASMYSTQRSESINAYFDGYLKKSMPLCELVQQYERAVDARREQENDADFDTIVKKPMLRIGMNIEEETSKIYTKKIFVMFQSELVNGYLCRHILKVFLVLDIQSVPPQYILKRWTKDAKSGAVVDKQGKTIQADCNVPITIRLNNICREANNIAAKASMNQHVYNMAIDGLHKLLMDVECALKSMMLLDQREEIGKLQATSHGSKLLLDPPLKNHKGRPKKLKSFLDKGKKGKTNSTNRKPNKKLMEIGTSTCEEIESQKRDCPKFPQVATNVQESSTHEPQDLHMTQSKEGMHQQSSQLQYHEFL